MSLGKVGFICQVLFVLLCVKRLKKPHLQHLCFEKPSCPEKEPWFCFVLFFSYSQECSCVEK